MASAILGALTGFSYGFRTTFTVTFEKILPSLPVPAGVTPPAPKTVPLPTIVPVSRVFFEADVTIDMPQAGSANSFTLTIYGMANDIFSLLDPNHTIVHISLGYADGGSSEVIAGILTEKHLTPASDGCFYQAVLKGVEYVFDRLQCAPKLTVFNSKKGDKLGAIASNVCAAVPVPCDIGPIGDAVDPLNFSGQTPLVALQALARRGKFALQVRDGKVRMGTPDQLGTDHPKAIKDGSTSKPVTTRGACPAGGASNDGQEFDMAGDPTLRPNDTVMFGTNQFRIQKLTHKFTRDGGYRCTGRALSASATHADQQAGGKPSAAQVARTIHDNMNAREVTRPAVSAGEVSDYTAGKHTASVNVGTKPTPAMANPTVQAPLSKDPGNLPDKPIASPFAFGPCGLVVPVYNKMRSLLVHGWNDPNDAVVDGFLWTSDMTPPPNKAGDWWLCLPTQLDGDGLPNGATTDDLITADGQRMISVKGMTITVGSGLLNQTGSRPTPGSDESLTVTTDQGAKLTVQGAQIQLTDGSVTVTVGNGKVSIS